MLFNHSIYAILGFINWQPYLKGQYRKYAIFIGLNCLTTGFVQAGINITSVTTIMVALNYVENTLLHQLSPSLRYFVLSETLHCAIIKFGNVIVSRL